MTTLHAFGQASPRQQSPEGEGDRRNLENDKKSSNSKLQQMMLFPQHADHVRRVRRVGESASDRPHMTLFFTLPPRHRDAYIENCTGIKKSPGRALFPVLSPTQIKRNYAASTCWVRKELTRVSVCIFPTISRLHP